MWALPLLSPSNVGIQGTKPLLSLRPHTVGTSPHHGSLSACCQLSLPDVLQPLFSLCCPAPASLVICGFKIDRQARNVARRLSCYQPGVQPQIFQILPLQQEEHLCQSFLSTQLKEHFEFRTPA